MAIVVQKYGGSSVATVEKLRAVAAKVVATKRNGTDVVVVVSAMGDTTDELLALAHKVAAAPPARELDMLLSVGERISMALLSSAIHDLGEDAISFTGSQVGIVTTDTHANARIIDVRPFRVQDELARGRIVIVAGYQGTSYKREITTLGRGGSDTTAVALAAALGADCEIYSDVDGVYSTDPRIVASAHRLDEVDYEEMQALARLGARVLNATAVEFARQRGIAIYAKSTFGGGDGTVVRRVDGVVDDALATQARAGVRGVAGLRDVIAIEAPDAACEAVAARIAHHAVVFSRSTHEGLAWTLSCENVGDEAHFCASLRDAGATVRPDLGAASLVGTGIGGAATPLLRARAALASAGLAAEGWHAAGAEIIAVVPRADVAASVRALHTAFFGHARPDPG